MQELNCRILELARPYLNTSKNDIHIEIVYRFAVKLLESEPGDPTVVLPAIICHDVGWSKVPEEMQLKAFGPGFDEELRRIHEVEGVKLTREILGKVNYDLAKTEEILTIIEAHDSRLEAISDNDKIVKDSDKLWRFDPIGLKIDVERFKVEQDHYINWLEERIDSWFFTETGKKLAREGIVKSRVL